MSYIVDQTITEFLNDLSCSLPAPSSGTAIGLVGSLAVSLGIFVCNLTLGKGDDEEKEILTFSILKDLEKARNELLKYMQQDNNIMLEMQASWKLPKDSQEEITARKNKIQEVTMRALQIPLNVISLCTSLFQKIEDLAIVGNKQLVSDVIILAILLNSTIKGSIVNVKVNSSSYRNNVERKVLLTKLNKLEEKANKFLEHILLLTKYDD
jgi:formiminotetrahydrofolate cyclodeaminase